MAQEEDRPTQLMSSIYKAHNSKEAVNEEDPKDHSECVGLIFMCDESTKLDCFKYRVFGLSEKKKSLLDIITKGMCLFLFDVKLKVLHGIYAASSDGGFKLEPDAFGGNFSWQVKFHIQKACIPLPEDVFKPAIKDNYFASRKFRMELTSEQVQKLVKLFSPLPVRYPSLDEPGCHNSPTENLAFSEATTCTQTHDRHTEGAADGYIRKDPSTQILYEPTSPLLDGGLHKKLIHNPSTIKYDPLCTTGCATCHLSFAITDHNHQLCYEAADPVESIITQADIHGFHALHTHHEHVHNDSQGLLFKKSLNVCNGVPAETCMLGICAPGFGADKACVSADLFPSHSQGCINLASCTSLWEFVPDHHLPASSETNFWSTKVNKEPYVGNSSLCTHVSDALLGHDCRVTGHKRSLGEMYMCAQSGGDAVNIGGGEMPMTCMYH